jgi:hypothetical protein
MKSAVLPLLLVLLFVIVSGGLSEVDVDSTGRGAGIGRKPMISTGNDNARRPLSYFTSLLPSEGTD